MNYHNVYGLTEHAQGQYQDFLEDKDEVSPEECVECGNCEEECPQELDIIEKLKETHTTLT